eukprot:6179471-Pleurochrysis_carterae.AAC.1
MAKIERYWQLQDESEALSRALADVEAPPPLPPLIIHDLVRHEEAWTGYYPKYAMLSRGEKAEIARRLTGLRYPRPIHTEPTQWMQETGMLTTASYGFLKHGPPGANEALMKLALRGRRPRYSLDRELSTPTAVVLKDAETRGAAVAFRGRQRRTPEVPEHVTALDNANLARVLAGRKMDLSEEWGVVQAARQKYGTVSELHGYSLGASKALQIAQEEPTMNGVRVKLINPFLGPRHVLANTIGDNVTIARTIEDFASGS